METHYLLERKVWQTQDFFLVGLLFKREDKPLKSNSTAAEFVMIREFQKNSLQLGNTTHAQAMQPSIQVLITAVQDAVLQKHRCFVQTKAREVTAKLQPAHSGYSLYKMQWSAILSKDLCLG